MNLRAPAVPLITIDPYFSIWSTTDRLNENITKHWTNKSQRLTGILSVDNKEYTFMGLSDGTPMKQVSLTIDALSTKYIFSSLEAELTVKFMTPLLLDDPRLCSRPVSYMDIKIKSLDGKDHNYKVKLIADDEICLDYKGQMDTIFTQGSTESFMWGNVGNSTQDVLNRSGDDIRIDWGYFYLAVKKDSSYSANFNVLPSLEETTTKSGRLSLDLTYTDTDNVNTLIALAYDDIKSINYFGELLDAYWITDDTPNIIIAIEKALNEYNELDTKCSKFAQTLHNDAYAVGGSEYAQLLALAYRQAIAAHKIVSDTNGELLFISKECFSNGCAATVDVTYPSSPLFLIYNPEFVKGMLRPIFKYATMKDWVYDFAPHDAGQYPLVTGQVYGDGKLEYQMPVEECGNMLILTASVCITTKDLNFASKNWSILEKWSNYLIKAGMDPDNQLCTDDFAGHLAHNCNLSIKAIMGIAGFSILCRMNNKITKADELLNQARTMAINWFSMAQKPDGTYKLAFDQEDSYSMKYNLIWDILWGTKVFDFSLLEKEFDSYLLRSNTYGMPLDNRADYTKSDWLVWCASLMESKDAFIQMIKPLYKAYDESTSRVPMTDWFSTKTSEMIGFQNRTVQGGLFIRLLKDKELCSI